jgi:hypothetical protein
MACGHNYLSFNLQFALCNLIFALYSPLAPAPGLTGCLRKGYYPGMIELGSLLFGLGFSVLVYVRSIRTADLPAVKKFLYFVITLIGITGMLFLSGVLIAHTLRKLHIL